MKFSADDIKKLANLAKLELSKAEVASYPQQLTEILSYIDKIKKLKTENLSPNKSEPMALRADRVQKSSGDFIKDLGKERLVETPNVFE